MSKAYPASLHLVYSLFHIKHSHADDSGSHDTLEAVVWEKTPANHLAILTCADACTFQFYSIQPGTRFTLLREHLATSSSRRLPQERRLTQLLLKRPAGHDAGPKPHRLKTTLSRPRLSMASEDDPCSNMDGMQEETEENVCMERKGTMRLVFHGEGIDGCVGL